MTINLISQSNSPWSVASSQFQLVHARLISTKCLCWCGISVIAYQHSLDLEVYPYETSFDAIMWLNLVHWSHRSNGSYESFLKPPLRHDLSCEWWVYVKTIAPYNALLQHCYPSIHNSFKLGSPSILKWLMVDQQCNTVYLDYLWNTHNAKIQR